MGGYFCDIKHYNIYKKEKEKEKEKDKKSNGELA